MAVTTPVKRVVMGSFVGVAFVVLQTYLRTDLGPEDDWWETVRREGVPAVHDVLEEVGMYATYPIEEDEYAGTLPVHPEEAEHLLSDEGFRRNPVAALKVRGDGEKEVGSWVYRESPLARRQLHVMLFERSTGQETLTDVYAHEEYSSLHPAVAYEHYREVDYDPERGKERVRDRFDLSRREVDHD